MYSPSHGCSHIDSPVSRFAKYSYLARAHRIPRRGLVFDALARDPQQLVVARHLETAPAYLRSAFAQHLRSDDLRVADTRNTHAKTSFSSSSRASRWCSPDACRPCRADPHRAANCHIRPRSTRSLRRRRAHQQLRSSCAAAAPQARARVVDRRSRASKLSRLANWRRANSRRVGLVVTSAADVTAAACRAAAAATRGSVVRRAHDLAADEARDELVLERMPPTEARRPRPSSKTASGASGRISQSQPASRHRRVECVLIGHSSARSAAPCGFRAEARLGMLADRVCGHVVDRARRAPPADRLAERLELNSTAGGDERVVQPSRSAGITPCHRGRGARGSRHHESSACVARWPPAAAAPARASAALVTARPRGADYGACSSAVVTRRVRVAMAVAAASAGT